ATLTVNEAMQALYSVDVAWIAFRFLLACVLVCAAFIEFDGCLIPRPLLIAPLVMGLLMTVLWPHLLSASGTPITTPPALVGLFAAIAGMIAAAVLAAGPWLSWWRLAPLADRIRYANAAFGTLVLVGAYLGIRGVTPVAVQSMALYAVTQLAAR